MKLYKTLFNQKSCDGGDTKYELGQWTRSIKDINLCEIGYHLTNNPFNWIRGANEIWLAESKGKKVRSIKGVKDTFACESIKIIKKLNDIEIKKLRKKLYPFDYESFSESLGDIPTNKDIIKLMKKINNIEFLKPIEKINQKSINLKVGSILKCFKINSSCKVSYQNLIKNNKFKENFDLDPSWISALNSAQDFKGTGRGSIIRFKWVSAWGSAWAIARDSTRGFSINYSKAFAENCKLAFQFEVIKDLAKEKGYSDNPFSMLLDLWEIGLCPLGIFKDGKFHIYYSKL